MTWGLAYLLIGMFTAMCSDWSEFRRHGRHLEFPVYLVIALWWFPLLLRYLLRGRGR